LIAYFARTESITFSSEPSFSTYKACCACVRCISCVLDASNVIVSGTFGVSKVGFAMNMFYLSRIALKSAIAQVAERPDTHRDSIGLANPTTSQRENVMFLNNLYVRCILLSLCRTSTSTISVTAYGSH